MGQITESDTRHEMQVERNVPIPMRDGTLLRADIYRPRAAGKYPTLIERVAYNLATRCKWLAEYYVPRGYVLIGQNVRGAYASQGRFSAMRDDGWGANRDGYDSIEWIAAQPWSNGNVGMLDGSYSGYTQYLVAPTRPPHLKALFVRMGPSDAYRDMAFRYGAFRLDMRANSMATTLDQVRHESAPPGLEAASKRLEAALKEMESWHRRLPLKSFPPLEDVGATDVETLNHPEDGPYWWPVNVALKFGDIDLPILHLGGWFDIFLDSTLRCFQGIWAHGRSEACRSAQRLIIGPWVHGPQAPTKRQAGELDFGPEAALDLNGYRARWYDHWLKGEQNGIMDEPPVTLFLMGANRWLSLPSWPPPGVSYREVYLREGAGKSEASLNNGLLTMEPPDHAERPDSLLYDPDDPISGPGGFQAPAPRDFRQLEGRMLTYTSPPLQSDLTVIGPVKAVLYGLSSAPDTDWVARLCDVWPDGRSMSVCDGILRARYRNSLEHPELLIPGQIYRFEVDLWATAQVFQAGHCLRLQVTSSDFPRYDRNLNTGGPFGEEVRGQAAVNTLFHDALRPSHLLLPVAAV